MTKTTAYRLIGGNICRQDVIGGRWEELSKDEANALLDKIGEGATVATPSGSIDVEGLPFTQPVPGHWSTVEGVEMANTYAAMSRDDLAYRQDTDFALANAIFMVSRHELELTALQTAAKERIRWLSAQLAAATLKEQALIDRIEALEAVFADPTHRVFEHNGKVYLYKHSRSPYGADRSIWEFVGSHDLARTTLSGDTK